MTDTDQTPPHRWVAEKMGYSIPGVSLLRSAQRQPTLDTMEAVERGFGWPIEKQVAHRDDYAAAFNAMLAKAYKKEKKK